MDAMAPHIELELQRKRPVSSSGTDSSSYISDRNWLSNAIGTSTLTGPTFSDERPRPKSNGPFRPESKLQPKNMDPNANSGSRKRVRTGSMAAPNCHVPPKQPKSTLNLSETSAVVHRQYPQLPVFQLANTSFVSTTSTVPNSPIYGGGSSGDEDVPLHSYQISTNTTRMRPATPPPTRAQDPDRHEASAGEREPAIGEEGADLLLYLATSPSPANPTIKARMVAPLTPPSHYAGLPLSLMNTPAGVGFMGGFGTPGSQFNFADFVNVTPSPAQPNWGNRTPAIARTPLAAREARRRLTFDVLGPSMGGSPNLRELGHAPRGKETGLGMELGGDLIP